MPVFNPPTTYFSLVTIRGDGIGAVATTYLDLENATAATALATVQESPALEWRGRVWDTAQDRASGVRARVRPVSQATPVPQLVFEQVSGDPAAPTYTELGYLTRGTAVGVDLFDASGNSLLRLDNSIGVTLRYGATIRMTIDSERIRLIGGANVAFDITEVGALDPGLYPVSDLVDQIGSASLRLTRVYSRRYWASGGTALVAGDFALSAGWGATASVGTITGDAHHARFTVTSAGAGQAANPTVTLTFKDGTWTNSPFAQVQIVAASTAADLLVAVTWTTTATTLVITFNGTPVAGRTYTFESMVLG